MGFSGPDLAMRAKFPALPRRVLLGSAAAALLPGLLHAAGAEKLVFITPQGFTIAFAPVLVGVAGGYFAKNGVAVSVVGGASSPQALQQVLSGQAQAGRTAGITLLTAVAKGAPCKAIATIAHGAPFYVISAAAHPVQRPADFVGGVVGVISPNGPAEVTLNAMLLSAGIDPATVQRQYVGDNPGAYGLIAAGRLRAFLGSFDTLARARAAGAQVVAFNTSKYMPLPGQIYAATTATIAARGPALVGFLRGVRDAIDAIIADTDGTAILRTLRGFGVQGLDDQASALAILRANQELWLSEGRTNLLRNIPQNWSRGVALAVQAGFGAPVPNDALFTNMLVDQMGAP